MADKVALSLGDDLLVGLRRATEAGFSCVEVHARAERPPEEREALADSGLLVLSAVLTPAGPLDHPEVAARKTVLADLDRQVADAALLGAVCVCLDSPAPDDVSRRAVWAEALAWLADRAARRMVRLAVAADVSALGHASLGRWLDGPAEGIDLPADLFAVRLADERRVARYLGRGAIVSVRLHSPHTSSSTSSLT